MSRDLGLRERREFPTEPPEGYTVAVCRLCNKPWYVPTQYVEAGVLIQQYECSYCINTLRRMRGEV